MENVHFFFFSRNVPQHTTLSVVAVVTRKAETDVMGMDVCSGCVGGECHH